MIGAVKQNGAGVIVYDVNGRVLFQLWGILVGYTSTTVTVKHDGYTKMYDDKGRMIRYL